MTIAELIQSWTDDGRVTRKQVGAAAGCSTQTVGMWACESWEPSAEHLRRMVGRVSDLPAEMKQQLLDWYLRDADYRAIPSDAPTARELDADGDGRVTKHDATVHNARLLVAAAGATNSLVEAEQPELAMRMLDDVEKHLRLMRATLTAGRLKMA